METTSTEVHGHVEPGFEGVRDAFVANFEREPDPMMAFLGGGDEVGAAVTVYVGGKKVVDLWGGLADRRTDRPYEEETLQLIFSTTKGITAICANLLAQRGLLDMDAPVAEYWPEFAQAGKHEIPVRWVMSHRGGVPWVDEEMTLEQGLDWDTVVDALARQAPVWEPGTQHGYHAITYGWLVGEVVRRVSGIPIGEFVQKELSGPLGLDLWIGLPTELHDRVAPLEVIEIPDDPNLAPMIDQFLGPQSMLGRSLSAPGNAFSADKGFGAFNLPQVWEAAIPAANGITDARSLARLYASCVGEVDGFRLLEEDTVTRAIERQTEGVDKVIMDLDLQYGLGFMVPSSFMKLGGPRSFGHYGAGGSVGFGDLDAELSFGYVMNRMFLGLSGDQRSMTLIDAAYDAL